MKLHPFDTHLAARIHPLHFMTVQASKSPGMCIPPQTYACLVFFNYNRQRVEVYTVKREELGSRKNELIGKLLGMFQPDKWTKSNYKVHFSNDCVYIQDAPCFDHIECDEVTYAELQDFIDEQEERGEERKSEDQSPSSDSF